LFQAPSHKNAPTVTVPLERPTKILTDDDWKRSLGIVYFLAAGNPPVAIKIGSAIRQGMKRRLQGLQCGNHETLELLGVLCVSEGEHPRIEADRIEREHHKRFAHLQRFKDTYVGHEWFTAAPELLVYIAEHTIPPEQVGLPRLVGVPINRNEQIE
jgi:hypothetical protein